MDTATLAQANVLNAEIDLRSAQLLILANAREIEFRENENDFFKWPWDWVRLILRGRRKMSLFRLGNPHKPDELMFEQLRSQMKSMLEGRIEVLREELKNL